MIPITISKLIKFNPSFQKKNKTKSDRDGVKENEGKYGQRGMGEN